MAPQNPYVRYLVNLIHRSTKPDADLAKIYARAAADQGPHRNALIVIPGLLGSKLMQRKTRRMVWGAFNPDSIDHTTPEGTRLMALPMAPGVPLAELRDDIIPTGVLDRLDIEVWGVHLELEAYSNIIRALGMGGYRDQTLGDLGEEDRDLKHPTCFQFHYDWRRDLVENARLLHRFIADKRAYLEKQYRERYGRTQTPVRFDILAHSLGGLLARYYLRYGDAELPEDGSLPPLTWAGAREGPVDRAILVGPPNAGAVLTFQRLLQGAEIHPLLKRYPAALLGTMPILYQILPRARQRPVLYPNARPVRDLLDPREWIEREWGLADSRHDETLQWLLPEVETRERRAEIAREHLEKCLRRARRVQEALDRPDEECTANHLSLHLIAGDAAPTMAQLRLTSPDAPTRVEVSRHEAGDGMVLRSSALLDERVGGEWCPGLRSPIDWQSVLFLFDDHVELVEDTTFVDNLLFLLLERPRDKFS